MKKVYKYATGEKIPDSAVYLWSCKNGYMRNEDKGDKGIKHIDYQYVWHYFLVDVKE